MKSINRKPIIIVCAVVSIVLFFLVLYFPVQPSGKVLTEGWVLEKAENSTPVQFPIYRSVGEMTTYTMYNQIDYSHGDALVITWFRSQAIKVFVNGQLVFSQGNLEAPTANIWNSTFLIQLPEPVEGQNTLEIQQSTASYPIYLPISPYILPLEKAEVKVGLINFLYEDLLLFSIGASVSIGLLLIILSVISQKRWSAEIFFGLASIFGAMECLDYANRISTGSLDSYFVVKKILMISGYLGALAFVAGVEKYYRDKYKISKILTVPTLISVFFIAREPSLIVFSNLLDFFNVVLLVDLVIVFFLIIKGQKGKDWLIIPAIWLVLGLMEMIAVQLLHLPWPFVMQYVLLMSTAMFGTSLLVDFNKVFVEKQDLEKRIDLDVLTSAYNRNVLEKAFPKQYDVLILMDLDNFKAYNDKHGHQKGDELLVKFTEVIKRNLRQQDVVVRYGGDEFLLLLNDIGIIDAEQVAKRIRVQFEELTMEENLSVSYGIETIENSLAADLNKADRLMYAMKQAKKMN